MKTKRAAWVAGLCLASLLAASSNQAAITLTFDENGHSSGFAGILSQQTLDNKNGSTANPAGNITTLDYLYPVDGNNDHMQLGWIVIKDPNGNISDLIRFDSSTQLQVGGPTYQQIFFYSSDADGDLADHFPSSSVVSAILASSTTVTITEGANGIALYTPTLTTQPGFHFIGSNPGTAYSYEFISSVPEPATIVAGALLLLPLGASSLRILRRKHTA